MSIPAEDNAIVPNSDLLIKVGRLLERRVELARERFQERIQSAYREHLEGELTKPTSPWQIWANWQQYGTDLAQRSVLFWDALRQRGNNYLDHERAGKPPVLHFDYEVVLDARHFARPVNYALLRIEPPTGVTVDPTRRPYVIIDPRAGHGPGIGGFKDDSQAGVAMRAGHPVYFVVFFRRPSPGKRCSTYARRKLNLSTKSAGCIPTAPSRRSSATAREVGPP